MLEHLTQNGGIKQTAQLAKIKLFNIADSNRIQYLFCFGSSFFVDINTDIARAFALRLGNCPGAAIAAADFDNLGDSIIGQLANNIRAGTIKVLWRL